MTSQHSKDRLDSIAELLGNGQYSDLVIRCEGRDFLIHKAIVCPAAPTLAAGIKHNTKESITSVIEHSEYDSDTVERVLRYIYTQDYRTDLEGQGDKNLAAAPEKEPSKSATKHIDTNGQLRAHARVFGLADYWNMPRLRTFAAEKFKALGVEDHGIELANFADVVLEVHMCSSSNDREMRNSLKAVAISHIHSLVADSTFMKRLAELKDTHDFMADMMGELVRKQNDTEDGLVAKLRKIAKRVGECPLCGESLDRITVTIDNEGAFSDTWEASCRCDYSKRFEKTLDGHSSARSWLLGAASPEAHTYD